MDSGTMSSTVQRETTPETRGETAADLDDEECLSPESRKLLEKCTASIAPVSTKEVSAPTLISRPVSSGVDMADFQFVRPAFQVPKLPGRPQPRAPETKKTQESRHAKPQTVADTTETISHPTTRE